jgi:hypothetical protein
LGNRGFSVDFYTRLPGAAVNLDSNARDLVVSGTVISLKPETFHGYDAVLVIMTTDSPKGYGEATVFATTSDSYSLVVLGPENPPHGYDRFIQSFQVLS